MRYDPATTKLGELSKNQLAEKLRGLKFWERDEDGLARSCEELLAHQLELEMQNRELREAQQALEESRQHYAELYDFAPVGYCDLDCKGVIREANITAANFFSVTKQELCGLPLAMVAHFADTGLYYRHLNNWARRADGAPFELVARIKGGIERVLELHSAPVLDADGKVTGFRVAFTDISERRLSEQRLRFLLDTSDALAASLEPARTLATMAQSAVPTLADVCCIDSTESASGGGGATTVFAKEEDGRALHEEVAKIAPEGRSCTPQAEAMRTRRSVIVDTNRAGQPQGDPARGAYNAMVVPLLARDHVLGAMTFIATSGKHFYQGMNVDLAEDLARRAALALDNARLHALAQRAVRAREKFLALVSHDLLGLLTVISMQTERLLGTKVSPASVPAIAKRIGRVSERMALLIQDLLDFASIDAGALSIEPRREPVAPLLAEALEHARELAAAKSLVVSHDVAPNLSALCDKGRILQVLGNLLSNAIKFCPPGGKICVTARPCKDTVVISVTDTGPGVRPEQVEFLFEHFWQGQKNARAGTGLGLPIVRGIVEASHGKVWVDTGVSQGAAFLFSLPSAAA